MIGFTGLLAVGSHVILRPAVAAGTLLGLLAGTTVGLVNGLLVAYGGVHSFVATLATGTLVYGAQLWYSRGEIIFEGIPPDFVSITRTTALGFTLPVLYAIVLAGMLWFVLAHTPFGRYLYAIGGKRRPPKSPGYESTPHRLQPDGIWDPGRGCRADAGQPNRIGAGSTGRLVPASGICGGLYRRRDVPRGEFNVAGTLVGVFLVAVLVTGAFQLGRQRVRGAPHHGRRASTRGDGQSICSQQVGRP